MSRRSALSQRRNALLNSTECPSEITDTDAIVGVLPAGAGPGNLEALVVGPRRACQLLDVGNTRLYQLINDGEFDTYLDGCSRKITVASIHRRIARLLAAQGTVGAHIEVAPPRRRGRQRKRPEATT